MLIVIFLLLLLTAPEEPFPRYDALGTPTSMPQKKESTEKPFKIAVAPTATLQGMNGADPRAALPQSEVRIPFVRSDSRPVLPPTRPMTNDELRVLTEEITQQIDELLRSSDPITEQNVFIRLEEVRQFPGKGPVDFFIRGLIRVQKTQKRTAVASDSREFRIIRVGRHQTMQEEPLRPAESWKIAQWILLLADVTESLRMDYRVSENILTELRAEAEKLRRQIEAAL